MIKAQDAINAQYVVEEPETVRRTTSMYSAKRDYFKPRLTTKASHHGAFVQGAVQGAGGVRHTDQHRRVSNGTHGSMA